MTAHDWLMKLGVVVVLTVLLLDPAAAYTNEPMCSDGTGQRAEMVMDAEGMTITYTDGRTERFDFVSSIGTGLNGQAYRLSGHPDQTEALFHTTIVLDRNQGHEDEPEIYLFRDQVWWPCSHRMMQWRLNKQIQKATGSKP